MDEFTTAYIETMLWSTTDNADDSGGEPLDANYDVDDIAAETLEQIKKDCAAFQEEAGELIEGREGQAGHDFWLTREGHGAGFWDGEWEGENLTDGPLCRMSKAYGSFDLYVGDDGKIHH